MSSRRPRSRSRRDERGGVFFFLLLREPVYHFTTPPTRGGTSSGGTRVGFFRSAPFRRAFRRLTHGPPFASIFPALNLARHPTHDPKKERDTHEPPPTYFFSKLTHDIFSDPSRLPLIRFFYTLFLLGGETSTHTTRLLKKLIQTVCGFWERDGRGVLFSPGLIPPTCGTTTPPRPTRCWLLCRTSRLPRLFLTIFRRVRGQGVVRLMCVQPTALPTHEPPSPPTTR